MRTPSTFNPDSNVEGVSPQDIMDNAIENRHIGDGEITNDKIAAGVIPSIGTFSVIDVNVPNSSLLRATLKNNDVTLIAAPGANKIISLIHSYSFYTTSSNFIWKNVSDANVWPNIGFKDGATYLQLIQSLNGGASYKNEMKSPAVTVANTFYILNKPLLYYCENIDDTKGSDGTGDLKIRIYYSIIDVS